MPRGGNVGNAGNKDGSGNVGNEGGAPIGNSNAQKTTRYICNCKGVEQSFATAQSLNKHTKSITHKRLTDPEFAKTEAAKKAEVKCKRKREKNSEAVQKANASKRLRLSKLKDREEEFLRNAKVSNDREADFIVGDGTEEDAKKALVRYHGSSSAAMLLDLDDNERTLEKIQKFIHVSKERKEEIRKLWEEGEMSDNKPLLVCASCGMRDHGEYAEEEVAKLPFFFEFKENDHARLDILKGFLSIYMSLYLNIDHFFSQVASSL